MKELLGKSYHFTRGNPKTTKQCSNNGAMFIVSAKYSWFVFFFFNSFISPLDKDDKLVPKVSLLRSLWSLSHSWGREVESHGNEVARTADRFAAFRLLCVLLLLAYLR